MQAIVIKWFIDKETMIPYSEGRLLDLSEERFQELAAKGVIDFAPDPKGSKKRTKK